ncbi:hypothetical protein QBC40DRAFT_292317 [Triangularia verruculosa]|uniref:Uncharacterized protein n=1 Tax=Triangularia verruculosa TaxID=2587418 RepID=A0AAN6XQV9_9PEZI|nr:hypothetical protein QBC40DRAFT_292317 [Triangularia verruculosa]
MSLVQGEDQRHFLQLKAQLMVNDQRSAVQAMGYFKDLISIPVGVSQLFRLCGNDLMTNAATNAPLARQSRSEQRDEAPKAKPPARPAGELVAPVNPYDPAEYCRGRSLWSQCAKPDLLQFFADFEEFRADGHVINPAEVHEAMLDALRSARQRPKDALEMNS